MSSTPSWVRRGSGGRHRKGAEHVAASAPWTEAAYSVAAHELREAYLISAERLAQAAIDDSAAPGAFVLLQHDGTLAEAERWNSGGGRIASSLLDATVSLDHAGLPPNAGHVATLFRLIDRLGETTPVSEWFCGLSDRVDCGEGLIAEALDPRITRMVLGGEADPAHVAELYASGVRSADRMVEALSHPASIAVGTL